jgi:TonB family protein
MSDRSPAFVLSLTLHAAVVAVLLFLSYAASPGNKEKPQVFELVAGAGDNYMATEAPALGSPSGVKLDLPAPPAPQPQVEPAPEPPAPQPAIPEPSPIPPAPIEKKTLPVKKADAPEPTEAPNFKKQITKQIIRAESQAKRDIKREREKEAKITKEAFDKANKAKAKQAANAKGSPAKVAKIDAEGIAAGVIGGSTKNKIGGAGGKALVAEDGKPMERYFSLLKLRLKENHEKPSGLSDTLVARVEFFVAADGSISRVRIKNSSGSAEFDRSVLEAFSRTRTIGARPDKKGETVELEFKMREEDSG